MPRRRKAIEPPAAPEAIEGVPSPFGPGGRELLRAVAFLIDQKFKERRPPEREALSLAAAATILGIDRVRTLPALIACGSVRAVNIAGHTRISRREIDRILDEGAPFREPVRHRRRRKAEIQAQRDALAAIDAIRVKDL